VAIVAIDNATGESAPDRRRDYCDERGGSIDMTRARARRPALKPFIYGSARERQSPIRDGSVRPPARYAPIRRKTSISFRHRHRRRALQMSLNLLATMLADLGRPILWRAACAAQTIVLPKTPRGPRDRPFGLGISLTIWRSR